MLLCVLLVVYFVVEGYSVDVIDSVGVLFGVLCGYEDDCDGLFVVLVMVILCGESRDFVMLIGGMLFGLFVYIIGSFDEEDVVLL